MPEVQAEDDGMTCFKHKAGLTLVEVMVAMAILVSTLGGFLTVFMMNQKTVVYANNQTQAMNTARSQMEALLSYAYNDARLSVGSHVVNGSCSYSVAAANNLKTIAFSISWTNPQPYKVASYVLTTAMSQAIHQ